jgi:hypothetical protein
MAIVMRRLVFSSFTVYAGSVATTALLLPAPMNPVNESSQNLALLIVHGANLSIGTKKRKAMSPWQEHFVHAAWCEPEVRTIDFACVSINSRRPLRV